ncbi:hypothetical protein GW916_09380 [bacterium]|nr:hypothetical protein [bacterium]
MITPDHVAARMFRAELRPYVGPLAIDNDYLTRVGVVADAVATKLVNFGIYEEATVSNLSRDEDDPRQLIVELDRTVFYPARGILIILV